MLMNLLMYKLETTSNAGMGYLYVAAPMPLIPPRDAGLIILLPDPFPSGFHDIYSWVTSVMSFSGSHVLMNLRAIGLQERNYGETTGALSMPVFNKGLFNSRNGTTFEDTETTVTGGWRTNVTGLRKLAAGEHFEYHEEVELRTAGHVLESNSMA